MLESLKTGFLASRLMYVMELASNLHPTTPLHCRVWTVCV